jgi:hypothetical protein
MRLEVLWRQLVGTGIEHLILNVDGGIHADGLAVGEIERGAYRIHYQIDCDADWNVLRLRIEDLLRDSVLALTRAADNRWNDADGTMLDTLEGCVDVDLMFTPFTNTLPIRRLNLKPGEARDLAVVYVGLPGLQVSRFRQRYTCLSSGNSGGTYRYESLESGFTAELKVDEDGLVVDYPNIFVMDAKRQLPD